MKSIATISLMLTVSAHAALEWSNTVARLEVHPVQVSATAVFRFSNTGNGEVSIEEVRPSCGCLSETLERKTYAPGEQGALRIDFDLLNRTGPQRKTVAVRTDDGAVVKLVVECDIPLFYEVDPKMVVWSKNDSVAAKSVRLVNAGSSPIRLLSAKSSNAGFSVGLKTVREGFEYEAVIERQVGVAKARAVIRIATEPPPGLTNSKEVKIYVNAL